MFPGQALPVSVARGAPLAFARRCGAAGQCLACACECALSLQENGQGNRKAHIYTEHMRPLDHSTMSMVPVNVLQSI